MQGGGLSRLWVGALQQRKCAFPRFSANLGEKPVTQKIETIIRANPYYVSSTFLNILGSLAHYSLQRPCDKATSVPTLWMGNN